MLAEPRDDLPLEESIPEGAAPLESILCTDKLRSRPRAYPITRTRTVRWWR